MQSVTSYGLRLREIPSGARCGSPLPVANLELRPENDGRTILHPTRVLCRDPRTGVNLHRHDLITVDELIDVAGRCRHPRHVVEVVLHAAGAPAKTGHT